MSDHDEFRLIRLLGRGGMGEVYLGHDTVLDRPVALKLIARPDEASRERFMTEARAIARLNHPNVVTIYRVGTTASGQPYIAQELIRGRSLDAVERPIAWRPLCEIAIGVARGLHAAHRCGVLHRDVKPANVMLDERGTAKLLDFGIAKLAASPEVIVRPPRPSSDDVAATQDLPGPAPLIESTPLAGSPTKPGGLVGTPRYAAPELWRAEPATERSDVYSLGVMLYELAAGTPPFPQTEAGPLRDAVLAGNARPIDELAADLPRAFATAIMRCLALDPADRPASASDLAHSLELILVDAPSLLPDGNPYRGLAPFGAAHRGRFFGRGVDIRTLVDRLRGEPLLAIVGDSGIGKSSLCHAGIVPEVVAGALGDGRRWRAISLVPGRAPWAAFLAACGNTDEAPERLARALGSDDTGTLVVIDQLEELATTSDADEAAKLARLLGEIGGGIRGVKALVTVRGDFLTRVATLPHLGDVLTRGAHVLRVLARDDLRDAIVGPARGTSVRFETDSMVDRLIDAVADTPGALPLLQFALAALWEAHDRERGVIPAAALDRLGGVEGALASHADAVLRRLPADARTVARRILVRLVGPDRTRAIRDRGELGGTDAATDVALEALVKGRLVVARDSSEGTATYELAHEALIRSWGTLRDMLADEAGQLAVRNRLGAAATEWQRLDRRAELLWTKRQLAELHALEDPTAAEAAFVDASRRRARRQLLARVSAIVAIPTIALGVLFIVRQAAEHERARAVEIRTRASAEHLRAADELSTKAADARRRAAFATFDEPSLQVAQNAEARYHESTVALEAAWKDSQRFAREADVRYRAAAVELEAALSIDAAAVREPMAKVLDAHAELAALVRDPNRLAELVHRLAAYDPARAARWTRPGRLVLSLDRPATITIHPMGADARSRIAGDFDANPIVRADGRHVERDIPPGSYVAIVSSADGSVVRDAFVVEPGVRLERELKIPATRPGWVYVPGGRFRYGARGDDVFRTQFLLAPPEHDRDVASFWIERTEVTFGAWLRFLRANPKAYRPTLATTQNTVGLEPGPDGTFELVLQPTSGAVYRAREGTPIEYSGRTWNQRVRWENLPVVGVSYEDALEYAAWLDRSGEVVGARPCTTLEWEHAARGADGRSYPHGENLSRTDANFDETYGRHPLAFGLDEVGTHPASDSPYGVADLVGNAWEVTMGLDGKPWRKGGSFYQDRASALAANNAATEPTQRGIRFGLRMCASAR